MGQTPSDKYLGSEFAHKIDGDLENIKLILDKKSFSNREIVNLKIESLKPILKNGNYAISVRKIDSLPLKKQISAVNFSYFANNS